MSHLRARREDLMTQVVDDGLVIYDGDTQVAHALTAAVAQVWGLCDGERSIEEIAEITGIHPDVVMQSVEELDECGLLEAADVRRFSRRSVMLGAAATGAGALIYSIPVPAALAATSSPPALAAVSGSPFSTGSAPYYAAFNPSGSLLAVPCPNSNDLYVFNVSTSGVLSAGTLISLNAVHAATFNPSGTLLAVAINGSSTVGVYTVSGTMLESTGTTAVGTHPVSVAFSPDGTLLAVSNQSDGSVTLFNVNSTTGALTNAVTTSTGAASPNAVAVAFSPDGSKLVVVNNASNSVSVFAVTAGSTTLGTPALITTGTGPIWAAFNQSGSLLAVSNSSSSSVSVFSVNAAAPVLTPVANSPFALASGASSPLTVAFSPSGGLLLVTCATSSGGEVEAFAVDSSTGALTQQGPLIAAGADANSVVFSSVNSVVAVTNTGTTTVSTYTNVSGL